MILIFLVILSFSKLILSESERSTCLLPFVIETCLIDGKNLSCTFSLNSFERNRTCLLKSMNLIFTTFHVELFLIPVYYHLIFSKHPWVISKLIIEPNITDDTFEYLHRVDIRIFAIEIPAENYQFALIHQRDSFEITQIRNHHNRTYWHLEFLPGRIDSCDRTVFTMTNYTTMHYKCPHMFDEQFCGMFYACFDRTLCHATGYRRLFCLVQMIRPWMQFSELWNISQYEFIFLSLIEQNSEYFHEINREIFMNNQTSSNNQSRFKTKHLVVIINNGILHLTSNLFDDPEDFHVRIEHGQCHPKGFYLDIVNETFKAFENHFIQWKTGIKGALGCTLNISE